MVIRDVADATQRKNLIAELQTHMDNAKVRIDDDPDEFYPGHTQRVSGLVTRSETVRALMLHEEATSMCEHFLLPNSEFGYQLHVSAALNIGPGARAQVLHREEDSLLTSPSRDQTLFLPPCGRFLTFARTTAQPLSCRVFPQIEGPTR